MAISPLDATNSAELQEALNDAIANSAKWAVSTVSETAEGWDATFDGTSLGLFPTRGEAESANIDEAMRRADAVFGTDNRES